MEIVEQFDLEGFEAIKYRAEPYDCLIGRCRIPGCKSGQHGQGTAEYWMVVRGEGLAVDLSTRGNVSTGQSTRCGFRGRLTRSFLSPSFSAITPRSDSTSTTIVMRSVSSLGCPAGGPGRVWERTILYG